MKILRANIWWNAIVPQVLGWIYFCWLFNGIELFKDIYPSFFLLRVLCFFISLISISAFGYLLNDWCDVETDAATGKVNHLSNLKPVWRFMVVVTPLIIGCVFWLPVSKIATALFVLQIIALIAYSVPPVRLKARSFWGVAADAFYGHINPVFITLFAFDFFGGDEIRHKILLAAVLLPAILFKGVRNILLHQLDDRKGDQKASIKTFVVKNGALFTLNFINNLLPFEIFLSILLSLALSFFFPPFFICLLFFSVVTYLKFSGWKLAYLPKRQFKFKFLYFLNDYYEGWLPVFFLILLSVRTPAFLILLLLHLFLFSSFYKQLWKDLKTIRQNFKTEDDY